jgi:serine/threonine-protein kinase
MRIGRYEILETLARGGMGVVYKAKDPLIERVVAIKTLGFGLSPIEAEAFRKRFAREAKSAGRLNHPNIVTIHDMGESDEGAYIAMEFLEGRTLRDILDSGVTLPPAQIAEIAIQVADGLAFAHQHGVVHCDVKPANVMVLESGAVKIMDFGIALLPTGSRTFAGNVLGSPRYISPEQIVGRPVDARSDIFALGAVLYEMLTGVAPFAAATIDEILYQVINEKPQAPSKRNPSLPPGFDAIVERAMAKHPDDRYQQVQDFGMALRQLELKLEPPASLPAAAGVGPSASPGAKTVELDTTGARPAADFAPRVVAAATAGSAMRRKLALFGIPVALVIAVAAWKLAFPPPSAVPVESVASSSASAPNTAQLAQAPAQPTARTSPLPPVLPPLSTRSAAPPSEPPPLPSNTVPAPTDAGAQAVAAVAPAPPPPMVRITFAIAPWGEIYIDGRKRGVTPPLTELSLPPGTYAVEVRNTTFAPMRRTIEVGVDSAIRIKHKFN